MAPGDDGAGVDADAGPDLVLPLGHAGAVEVLEGPLHGQGALDRAQLGVGHAPPAPRTGR